jgi:hypothetical protein
VDGFLGSIASRSSQYLELAGSFPRGDFDDSKMLLAIQGWRFPRGAHWNKPINPGFNLGVNQAY